MKEKGTHEGCIEQMLRLFSTKLYGNERIPVDGERLIRMDDWELDTDTQARVKQLISEMTSDNFMQIGDYVGFKQEFLNLNGFDMEGVDYSADINIDKFIK
jgi:enoyl-[acyl-carrier protein] reductase/trans-2-enoyl-CoA reductase (NAD+)